MFSRRVLGADNVVTSREAKGTNKEKPHCVRHRFSHVSAGSVAPVPRSADAPVADHAPAEPHRAAPSPAARTVVVPLPAAPARQARAPVLAPAPLAATGIQGRWRQVPWSGSCNGGVAAKVAAWPSNCGEEGVHGVFSMVEPSMVTPARFERAIFGLGGRQPAYTAQGFRLTPEALGLACDGRRRKSGVRRTLRQQPGVEQWPTTVWPIRSPLSKIAQSVAQDLAPTTSRSRTLHQRSTSSLNATSSFLPDIACMPCTATSARKYPQ